MARSGHQKQKFIQVFSNLGLRKSTKTFATFTNHINFLTCAKRRLISSNLRLKLYHNYIWVTNTWSVFQRFTMRNFRKLTIDPFSAISTKIELKNAQSVELEIREFWACPCLKKSQIFSLVRGEITCFMFLFFGHSTELYSRSLLLNRLTIRQFFS